MVFTAGETVICTARIRNSAGVLVDPSTSTKITITDNRNGIEVNSQNMVKESTGIYYYDWNTTSTTMLGIYCVTYTAVDSGRTSIAGDKVEIT